MNDEQIVEAIYGAFSESLPDRYQKTIKVENIEIGDTCVCDVPDNLFEFKIIGKQDNIMTPINGYTVDNKLHILTDNPLSEVIITLTYWKSA